MNTEQVYTYVDKFWDSSIIPTLSKYIEIPNQSPAFDKEWKVAGHTDKAVALLTDWVKAQNVPGLELEVLQEDGRTPLIFMTVPSNGDLDRTILMYGHFDKQPPLTDSWAEGLHPYKPVIKDGKLYGRGGADDGYSIFAAICAIKSLKESGAHHSRIVIVIEGCEESGSPDLPHYISKLKDRIRVPDLIVCLDSGCGTYDQFWITTSLRGIVAGILKVEVTKEGSHSGHASGIVASSFRVIRQLLTRLEDENTGEIKLKDLHCDIPAERLNQAKLCAATLGHTIVEELPILPGVKTVHDDIEHLLINRTWKPTLCVIGVDGIPDLAHAGNVLRPYTAIKLSIRVPPRVDAPTAAQAVKKLLEENPPYNAKVTFECDKDGSGWDAPALVPWLEKSINDASSTFFKKPANFLGEGGSIPFMGMLGKMFPEASFCVTGVLGPQNNAHGPNEMLVIDMGKKVTACVAKMINDHYVQYKK
jgi:acetylornithine deacetylase/succinyl-diaminopimelate desuccinylase-like protein